MASGRRPAKRSRRLAVLVLLLPLAMAAQAAPVHYPPVLPGAALRFPADQGSHPAFRTEWWYVTGRLESDAGPLGFQITFFRSRPSRDWPNPSAFAPRQLLFAHAALADPRQSRLLHDERAARAGFGLAEALAGRTAVWIDDWSLQQTGAGYRARIPAKDFTLELTLTPSQPILLQGDAGFSQKSPERLDASYYYSQPQLRVTGAVLRQGRRLPVQGRAWLDHEWSSRVLHREASGWDWLGLNLDDGGALMLFRIRDAQGGVLWAGGTHRDAAGRRRSFQPDEIRMTPVTHWTSPRTRVRYPVAWDVRVPGLQFRLQPLMADQELDARASTGTIYWEGAVDAVQDGRRLGQGYLELTGYGQRLRM